MLPQKGAFLLHITGFSADFNKPYSNTDLPDVLISYKVCSSCNRTLVLYSYFDINI